MGARENLQRLADRKQAELDELIRQVEYARIYLQAMQDSIRALPRESSPVQERSSDETKMRAGSHLAKAQEAIQHNGSPMYIDDLMRAIGMDVTKKSRVSLIGSLGTYVRRKTVFTRPQPNTFGLLGMKADESQTSEQVTPEYEGESFFGDEPSEYEGEDIALPAEFGQ